MTILSSSTGDQGLALACELGANACVVKLHGCRAVERAVCEIWCGSAAVRARDSRLGH